MDTVARRPPLWHAKLSASHDGDPNGATRNACATEKQNERMCVGLQAELAKAVGTDTSAQARGNHTFKLYSYLHVTCDKCFCCSWQGLETLNHCWQICRCVCLCANGGTFMGKREPELLRYCLLQRSERRQPITTHTTATTAMLSGVEESN